MMVLAMPVLLLVLLGTIEMGMRIYYKAQVRSVATAAAVAAVGTQVHWPIPIPTRWVVVWPGVPVPVDGIVINTLHLPNVDWPGDVRDEAATTRDLTNPAIQLDHQVFPLRVVPLPFKGVKITAKINTPLVFSKIFGAGQIDESACAIAWIRPEYWKHGWWDDKSAKSLFGVGDEPYRYYRLVPCRGIADVLEAVITAHFEATRELRGNEMRDIWKDIDTSDSEQWQEKKRSNPRPKDEDEVAKCVKGADCRKQEPQTYTCSTDGKTKFTVTPEPWTPGTPEITIKDLEAKYCPPPPPPPPPAKN